MFTFPESLRVRKLAASLASSLSATNDDSSGLHHGLSAGLYLRRFPWHGIGPLPATTGVYLDDCTVGQYFATFNFSGEVALGGFGTTPILTGRGRDGLHSFEQGGGW